MTEFMEAVVVEDGDRFARTMRVDRVMYSVEASFAMELVKAMSVVPTAISTAAGEPFKETSPVELVDRAMEISRLTIDALLRRGWAKPTPPFDELRRESGGGPGFGHPGGTPKQRPAPE